MGRLADADASGPDRHPSTARRPRRARRRWDHPVLLPAIVDLVTREITERELLLARAKQPNATTADLKRRPRDRSNGSRGHAVTARSLGTIPSPPAIGRADEPRGRVSDRRHGRGAYFSDPKVTALLRRLRDPVRTMVDLGHCTRPSSTIVGRRRPPDARRVSAACGPTPLDEWPPISRPSGSSTPSAGSLRTPPGRTTSCRHSTAARSDEPAALKAARRSWQSRRDQRRRSDASAVPNPSVSSSSDSRPAVRPSRPVCPLTLSPTGRPGRPLRGRPTPVWPEPGAVKPSTSDEAEPTSTLRRIAGRTTTGRLRKARRLAIDLRSAGQARSSPDTMP